MTPGPAAIRLLIVDDDAPLCEALGRRFQKTGASVTLVCSGEEALAAAEQERFDVALLDLHLPGLNGLEVLAKLKEAQPELEAIMLTGHASIETAIQAMKRGAYDYLTKPFDVDDILGLADRALEKRALEREVVAGHRHLDALEADHAFLLRGDVFTEDLIRTWISWKRERELDPMRLRPHPHEFYLYYDN